MEKTSSSHQTALDEVIERLHGLLPHAPADALDEFYRRLLSRGSADLIARHSAEEVADLLAPLYRLVEETPPGQVGVRIHWAEDGSWGALQTVMPDCPFIVDTLREYVHALDLRIPHLMHPVLSLERDDRGRILAVADRSAGGAKTSVVHLTLDAVPAPESRAAVEAEVRRRLEQVLAVTEDFPRMLDRATDIEGELEEKKDAIPWRAGELEEIRELLRWMRDPGFVFLGYREYEFAPDEAGRQWIRVVPGTGLGILRDDDRSRYREPKPIDELAPDLRARVLGGPLLIVSKTNAESPVRRRAQMDYIGIKRLASDGTVCGEYRFLGLFTAKAFGQDASSIPILRRKLREIVQLEGAPRGSHDYNLIFQTFNSMPKEELFLSSVEEIRAVIDAVKETEGADHIRVTARPDALGRGYNVMVILPKNRFSAAVRRRLQAALVETVHGRVLNYHLALGQGDQARLHFYVAHDQEESPPDVADLEAIVRETTRSWEERLEEHLAYVHGATRARELTERYGGRFPSDYQAAVDVDTAVADVFNLSALDESGEEQATIRQTPDRPGTWELKIFARRGTFVLSDLIPSLENLGLRVLDAYRWAIAPGDEGEGDTIHVLLVELARGVSGDPVKAVGGMAAALRAVYAREAEDDKLNSLILAADLTWQEVGVLRAYAGYAFRIGAVVSRTGAVRPLTSYPRAARLLFEAFRIRFDPDFEGDREEEWRRLHRKFHRSLSDVRGIEDDRTLRRLIALVQATERTNYYRGELRSSPLIAIKIACRSVEFMPEPRPRHEVYLRGARTEAAHLRMDDVARGGIRWSDRYEDFRVEVLGLVKTQRVKNAVIVPAGAKGAFIARRLPEDRARRTAAALESYKEFIRGLLEITDNVVDGEVVHPERVVIHDGPDPYLVVAADKGTAKNSDTANQLAEEAGFWLGDAFASGGSNGYDHKVEGITARGAWECVKRHFREMDLDWENTPFTVVGIGDMSGDVFGNGMLLSRQIRLIAAFDHRHIFLDPDPDPARSWEERKRLFDLATSSWDDYDRSTLSPGGGVFERTAKEIPISEEVRRRLDLREETLNGEELIRAILRAEVDLLWNGGIGTYVKATHESHADVGDPGNDGVRVDATELRARVVGEGGNLGFTQGARVEYALAGGRINTDALDNSAGVDMSDHEVNLKILLSAACARGSLKPEARNDLLRACTEQVSRAVLLNNVTQSLAVSLDERRAEASSTPLREAMSRLEREGVLDPALEELPSFEELDERESRGRTLTRPELAVLLAHAKLHLKHWLQSSGVPHDPAMLDLVRDYFPPRALEAIEEADLEAHRLRPHIASTVLTNLFVDRMGAASCIRLVTETDRGPASVARGWYIASRISDADALYAKVRAVDGRVRSGTQYQWYLEMAESLARATSWLLHRTDRARSIQESIDWLHEPVRDIRAALPDLLTGERLERFHSQCALHEMDGLDGEAAAELATFRYLNELLPIARLIRTTGAGTIDVGKAYLGLAEDIDFPWLRACLDALSGGDLWAQKGARILIGRLEVARSRLAALLLETRGDGSVEQALERFRHEHAVDLSRIRTVISDIRGAGTPTLAALLVAVDAVSREGLSAPRA